MSSDLKDALRNVVEEDCEKERKEIERKLDHYKSLLLEIARVKRFNLAVSVEGFETQYQADERDLDFLERANLVKGEMNFTHHNEYREYQLTKKGAELAAKLMNETGGATTVQPPST